MIRVLLNADDLGLHPAVQRAVERCAQAGTLTSASVLANGPAIADVRPIPHISFGAHLNILRGAPLSPPSEVRSLLGANGCFLGSFTALWIRLARNKIVLHEIELEWSRQVESLLARGWTLSHLDGEKHTHCLPELFAIACRVAQKFSIPWVRRSVEQYGAASLNMGLVRKIALKRWCATHHANPSTVHSPTAVWGIAHQGSALTPDLAARAFRGAESGSIIEIVCHPGDLREGDPSIDPSFGSMNGHETLAARASKFVGTTMARNGRTRAMEVRRI